jgi:YD repeat-containing protein
VTQNTYNTSTGYLIETIADYGTGKLNATTQITYDTYGHVATVEDPNGNTVTATTNALDQITEIDGAESEVETFNYDGDRKVIVDKKQAPSSETEETDTVYNSYEQITGIKKYTGSDAYLETTFTYDYDGNQTSVTDPYGDTVATAYDERNMPYLFTDALSNSKRPV